MRVSRSRRVEDAPLARCVQHACHTDPCAKALRTGSDGGHCLGGGAEQQSIDGLLVPVSDASNLCGECEGDVGSIRNSVYEA